MMAFKLSFVKICGITRMDDAVLACSLGASALGFVAYPKSKRYISSPNVRVITSQIVREYPQIKRVGVFVNENIDTILTYLNSGINVIQLHGDETVEYVCKLNKTVIGLNHKVEIWRAVRLRTEKDVIILKDYSVDKFLIDSFVKNEVGGTGVVGDWELAEYAVNTMPGSVILAGGLTSENINKAIKKVHPFGVDISSGIESVPGIKNHDLMKRFMDKIKK